MHRTYVQSGSRALRLVWNFRFDQMLQQSKGFLPAEVTHFLRNSGRYAFLEDRQLGADRHVLQGDGHRHLSRQLRIIKRVRESDALVRHQFQVRSAEGVAFPRREVRKGHVVLAAHHGVILIDRAGEPVGRQPFALRVALQERAVETFGRRP